MDAVRDVCSAALSLRKAKGLRVRLPLPTLTVATPSATALEPFADLVADEVNVKSVAFTDDVAGHCSQVLTVVPRVLGPRLGGQVQQVIKAVKAGEWSLVDGRPVVPDVTAGGRRVRAAPGRGGRRALRPAARGRRRGRARHGGHARAGGRGAGPGRDPGRPAGPPRGRARRRRPGRRWWSRVRPAVDDRGRGAPGVRRGRDAGHVGRASARPARTRSPGEAGDGESVRVRVTRA